MSASTTHSRNDIDLLGVPSSTKTSSLSVVPQGSKLKLHPRSDGILWNLSLLMDGTGTHLQKVGGDRDIRTRGHPAPRRLQGARPQATSTSTGGGSLCPPARPPWGQQNSCPQVWGQGHGAPHNCIHSHLFRVSPSWAWSNSICKNVTLDSANSPSGGHKLGLVGPSVH